MDSKRGDIEMKNDEGMQHVWHPEGGPAPPPVVTIQPGVVPVVINTQVGPKPASTTCPSCNQQIVTRVQAKASTKTHMIALCLCCCACWPCACVPYCMDSCQNADHYCPHCNAFIGSYKH